MLRHPHLAVTEHRVPEVGGRALLADALVGARAGDRVRLLEPPEGARELTVLDKLVQGQPNKIVAHELGISPRTVEIHRAHIMLKMEASNLADLVRTVLTAQSP